MDDDVDLQQNNVVLHYLKKEIVADDERNCYAVVDSLMKASCFLVVPNWLTFFNILVVVAVCYVLWNSLFLIWKLKKKEQINKYVNIYDSLFLCVIKEREKGWNKTRVVKERSEKKKRKRKKWKGNVNSPRYIYIKKG